MHATRSTTNPACPLQFEPIYKEKVWGGRSLERLFARMLLGGPDTLIGESWELADLAQTSASGGGGAAERSRIINGSLAGTTLHDAIAAHGRSLLGDLPLTTAGNFPLLVKFLDAQQNLSVQVHPSPAYAAAHPEAHLKSEAWYIVDAAPGAVIYKGVRQGVTAEQFRDALKANTDEAVVPLLVEVPVKPGDCHYLPSGTCHALGAGIVVAEVQTPSDTTFRVYDWGRQGRELHVDAALASMTLGPADVARHEKQVRVPGRGTTRTQLVTCEYFRIDRIEAEADYSEPLPVDQPLVWMTLAGEGVVTYGDRTETRVVAGQTTYLPPAMQAASLRVGAGRLTWLEVTFPQAERGRLA
ncbi:MAG: type I phosphomannose isomerase catalytic subunit [Phycisphaeraceae bacterium]